MKKKIISKKEFIRLNEKAYEKMYRNKNLQKRQMRFLLKLINIDGLIKAHGWVSQY